jgi:hypothetical protein
MVALVAANIYTTTTCLTTHDHLTIHPIEPIHTRGRNMCIPAGRKLAFLILWGLAPKPPGLAALVVFLQSVVSLNRAITISVYF